MDNRLISYALPNSSRGRKNSTKNDFYDVSPKPACDSYTTCDASLSLSSLIKTLGIGVRLPSNPKKLKTNTSLNSNGKRSSSVRPLSAIIDEPLPEVIFLYIFYNFRFECIL